MTELDRSSATRSTSAGPLATWTLTGAGGAVTFTVQDADTDAPVSLGIGLHRRVDDPGAPGSAGECDVLPERVCHADVAYRAGADLLEHWLASGRCDVTVFAELETWYESRFA